MRISFCLLLVFIFTLTYSKEKTDSSSAKLKVNGNVSLNSNGFAPIPSFSLDKPALIAALTLQRKRFSFDPQIAYGLNMRPWLIDNWLHYRLILKPRFELRIGLDFSMFFSEYDTGETKILQGQKYLTFEVASIYKFSPKSSITLMCWSDNGQDPGSIKGYFYNILYDRTDIEIGESILFSGSLQLFCISYTGNNDGLFISPRIAASVRNVPLSLFFQATQSLTTDIEPDPGFRWNVGVAYLF
jgi:hypothetical protein